MAAQPGFLMLLKRGATTAGPFTTIGALQSTSLALNANPIDVTTLSDADINDILWRTYISGLREMTINGNGTAKTPTDTQELYTSFSTGTPIAMQLIVPNLGAFVAQFLVTEIGYEGNYDGAVQFSLTLNLTGGAPVFTAET